MKSPVGTLLLVGTDKKLSQLSFQDGQYPVTPDPTWVRSQAPFQKAIQQLREYFSGTRKTFTINLAPQGTRFQQKVWQALERIPYGETVSYSKIANAIGNPKASRAVGAANGKNPLSIFIPCHRVIGSTGKLVGYGGGLGIKERLLALETKH